jgi:hypothetical protein
VITQLLPKCLLLLADGVVPVLSERPRVLQATV